MDTVVVTPDEGTVREQDACQGSMAPAMGFRQCPVCASWDTVRHAEGFRVWFTCNRCGAVFA